MGRRCPTGRLRPRLTLPHGRGHHRPSPAAAESHLVPGHQPPPPDAPHAATGLHPPADLAEIVRLYGLRPWIQQSYKQIKDELGWADFQVRSDRAIRRHQTLVNCAFSFCWDQWFAPPGPLDATAPDPYLDEGPEGGQPNPTHPNCPAGPGHYVRFAHGSPPPPP
ncbi:hypothetical protein [Streptomyces sp. NPDC047042]|uniref:hypothetical protein n=1 Tax=Streptomyces sp. NPDC047042 TaxID=3154807 RepID=UPI0033F82284